MSNSERQHLTWCCRSLSWDQNRLDLPAFYGFCNGIWQFGEIGHQRSGLVGCIILPEGEKIDIFTIQKAADIFAEICPDADVNLLHGGQPVYYYLISAE